MEMEIGNQIRKYRSEKSISQEQLAEMIYVSRQTISSWENGRSYPDIHSLVLLSEVFEISLDTLIKGDIEAMKKEVRTEDIKEFDLLTKVFNILCLITAVSSLAVFLMLDRIKEAEPAGIICAVVTFMLYAVTMIVSFRVEKFKKNHDLRTYREIIAFTEGKTLDEIDTAREDGKLPYQKVLMALAGAGIAIVLIVIAVILKTVFHI